MNAGMRAVRAHVAWLEEQIRRVESGRVRSFDTTATPAVEDTPLYLQELKDRLVAERDWIRVIENEAPKG